MKPEVLLMENGTPGLYYEAAPDAHKVLRVRKGGGVGVVAYKNYAIKKFFRFTDDALYTAYFVLLRAAVVYGKTSLACYVGVSLAVADPGLRGYFPPEGCPLTEDFIDAINRQKPKGAPLLALPRQSAFEPDVPPWEETTPPKRKLPRPPKL